MESSAEADSGTAQDTVQTNVVVAYDNAINGGGNGNAGKGGTSTIPRVVKFSFKYFKTSAGKWSATCTFCNKTLADRTGVSSSFTK